VISALRRVRPVFLGTVFSALVLLPPSGWSLCIGANGHFEIEPAAPTQQPCCETLPASPIPDTCAPDDCASCLDVALSPGSALRSRADGLPSLPIVAAPAPLVPVCASLPLLAAPPGAALPARPGGPWIGTVLLRC